jgi:hypothetical protein
MFHIALKVAYKKVSQAKMLSSAFPNGMSRNAPFATGVVQIHAIFPSLSRALRGENVSATGLTRRTPVEGEAKTLLLTDVVRQRWTH